jgi:hypothetical protein
MTADRATKMRCFLPIPVLESRPGQEDHRMVTIGRIPAVVNRFFRPARPHFSKPAWPHFWGLVMAMAVGIEHTVGRLNGLLHKHTHRTNDGELLWRSHGDQSEVLRAIALQQFSRLYRRGETIYFILDDTQTLQRAKKMEAVGKLYHHAEKRYATGHTILKACLYYRGVTIPWGSWLYVKKQDAARLGEPPSSVGSALPHPDRTGGASDRFVALSAGLPGQCLGRLLLPLLFPLR